MRSRIILQAGAALLAVWLAVPALAQTPDVRPAQMRAQALLQDAVPDSRALRRLVTLSLVDAPLPAALEQIARQAALTLSYAPDLLPPDARVTLRAERMPAGEAIARVLEGTGLEVRAARSGPVTLVRPPPPPKREAQTGTISGRVTDRAEGAPINGASVRVSDTQRSAVTASDGRYTISNVPAGTYTLVVEMIGYSTRSEGGVEVRSGDSVELDFQLTRTALRLDEVVATGVSDPTAGTKLPFTVSTVQLEDVHVPQAEVLSALRGRISGARVRQTDGMPGQNVDILLRTPTSIARGNAPMYVVDGVILAEGGALRDIDGFDIESIEVVKGAAGASLYGSRASNGVVRITTRRGSDLSMGQARFSLRTNFGIEEIPPDRRGMQIVSHAHPYLMDETTGDWLDADGNVVDRVDRVTNEFGIANTPWLQTYDHIDQVFKRGTTQSQSLSMSQRTENTRFLISATNHEQSGIVRMVDPYTRRGLRVNLDHELTPKLNLGVSSFFSRTTWEPIPDPNPLYQIFFMPADVDLTAPDPEGEWEYNWMVDPTLLEENPLYALRYNDREQARSRFLGSLQTSYSPTPWLRVDGSLSLDRSDVGTFSYWPVGFREAFATTLETGQIERSVTTREALNGSANVRLMHRFGDLTVRGNLRYLMEANTFDNTFARGRDLAARDTRSLNLAGVRTISSSSTDVRSEGYYLNMGLDYDDRIVGDFLVRQDGSSLFGSENRWNTYYRAAGAYRVSQETWWPFDFLSELKLHASIGTAGGRPSFADRFETWGISGGRLVKSTLGNEHLKPELATEREFGILAIVRDRYSLQLTRALSKVEDQLLNIPLPGVLGYTSQWHNAGTLEGNTWELELAASLVNRPDLSWSVSLNADRMRHEITEFNRQCYHSGGFYRCAGSSLGSRWGAPRMRQHADLPTYHASSHDAWDINDEGWLVPVGAGNTWRDGIAKGLWHTEVEIDGRTYNWGHPVAMRDDEGNLIEEEVMNTEPDFTWALSSSLRWGRWELGGLLDAQVGGQIYNSQLGWAHRDGNAATFDQTGKPEHAQKPMSYVTATQFHTLLEDAGFVKLRELAATYRFGPGVVDRLLGTRSGAGLSVALSASNLFTWSDYSGWDPEVGSTITTTEYAAYPAMRTISVNLQVDF